MATHGIVWMVSAIVLNAGAVRLCAAGQPAPHAPSAEELLERYTRALDAIQSFISGYEGTSEWSSHLPQTGMPILNMQSFRRGRHCADGRRVYNEAYIWGDFNTREMDLPESAPRYHLRIEAEGKVYVHTTVVNNPRVKGRVYLSRALREKAVLSREPYSGILGFLGTDERLDAVLRSARRLSVRPATEDVNGSPCQVIDADTAYGSYTVWLDPQHGCHAARVTFRATSGHKTYDDFLPRGVRKTISVEDIRFGQIDGVWVPMEGTEQSSLAFADPRFFHRARVHFKRMEIALNPDHEALGSFRNPLEYPDRDPELRNGKSVAVRVGQDETKCVWQDGKILDESGAALDMSRLGY